MMDREEDKLRHSRFLMPEAGLREYVADIACRLAGTHCPDMRVYLLRTPFFNASMAPNGMMQVWSGLLLRVSSEAQLAAVLAHEIGHYLKRHSIERLRDARSKSAFGQFLGMALGVAGAGSVGSLAQLGVLASLFAFSREQEREADMVGLELMHAAGYDPLEASHVWRDLMTETEGDAEARDSAVLFATHPAPQERRTTLETAARTLAEQSPGERHAARYLTQLGPVRMSLLQDELRRRKPEASIRVFDRLLGDMPGDGQLLYARAEALRLRGQPGDAAQALMALDAAEASPLRPVEALRLRGQMLRQQGDSPGARRAFARYLELRPDAPDAPLIRSYLEDEPT